MFRGNNGPGSDADAMATLDTKASETMIFMQSFNYSFFTIYWYQHQMGWYES